MSKTYDPTALLAKPMSDVKPPEPAALGSYVATIVDRRFDKTTGEKKTDYVEFEYRLDEAGPDVDQEALAAWLDGESLSDKSMKRTFYITPAALFMIKDEAIKTGLTEEDASNLGEAIEQMLGRQILITVGQSPNKKNPERPYANIDSSAAVPGA